MDDMTRDPLWVLNGAPEQGPKVGPKIWVPWWDLSQGPFQPIQWVLKTV